MEFRRLRSVEHRIDSLERAVYPGVSAEQSIHAWDSKVLWQNGEDGICSICTA